MSTLSPLPQIQNQNTNTNLTHLSEEEQSALQASIFQRLHPRLYLERYVAEGVRPDGRPLVLASGGAGGGGGGEVGGFRDVEVNLGSISTADGSALVRMGETTVVCGVKAEIAEPELDREQEGFLVPNVDLPAMCSPKFKPGPPSEEAQVLSDRLNQALVTSNFLPLSTLCIHPGKAAWVIYVDATCINYDGNIFDATLLAMVAALRNTTLPQATYNPETGRTVCSRNAPRVPLKLSTNIPVSSSFGIFDSKHILADPTSFEEPLLESSVSVILGEDGDNFGVNQLGSLLLTLEEEEENSGGQGKEIKRDVLVECIESAKRRRERVVREVFS